ncbi:MAG: hypothetical protein AAF386_13735 [Pseudomonadota bacterium]
MGHTHEHAHESPTVMLTPLAVLAVGAILAGMVWYKPFFGSTSSVETYFGIEKHAKGDDHAAALSLLANPAFAAGDDDGHGDDHGAAVDPMNDPHLGHGAIYMHPDNHVLHEAHEVAKWVKLSPFIAMVFGFLTAFAFYMTNWNLPQRFAQTNAPLYRFLLNKWYVDEIYDVIFVRPARWIGNFLWKKGDGTVIDGGINGLAMGIVPFFTKWANRAQSGYIFTYALGMVIGVAILISWAMISGT